MERFPLLSVIIPVYKVEAYIDRCIRSLVEQTYDNLEIILVDDGSPDNSGAICDAWAAKDSRIKVIHKANGGSGAARNTALDAATGELIAFVDSDDYIAPDMYKYLYGILQQGADIAECGYADTFVDDMAFGGGDGEIQWYTTEEALLGNIHDQIFRQLIWNKLYRRHCVEGVRFPVGTTIDDEFFTYKLLGNAKKLARSEKVLYAYRQQDDSVMHRPYSLKRLDSVRARQERAVYMASHFPELGYEARVDLFYSCLFAMQRCLRELPEAEKKLAKKLLKDAANAAKPLPLSKEKSLVSNLTLLLGQVSFLGTSRLLNLLSDLHIL